VIKERKIYEENTEGEIKKGQTRETHDEEK
jgi:hypothetical protein